MVGPQFLHEGVDCGIRRSPPCAAGWVAPNHSSLVPVADAGADGAARGPSKVSADPFRARMLHIQTEIYSQQ